MAASNHTSVQAHNKDGHQLNVQHTSTDSPILPAENLRQLQAIDPQLVQWVITQTELESSHRRHEETKINWFILIERMSGVIIGGLVAVFGLSVGAYLILQGHDWAGVGISGVGLASIVSVLVARQQSKQKNEPSNKPPIKKKPRPQNKVNLPK